MHFARLMVRQPLPERIRLLVRKGILMSLPTPEVQFLVFVDDVIRKAFESAKLGPDALHRLMDSKDEFEGAIGTLIRSFARSDKFIDEETESIHTYTRNYYGPRPIEDQIAEIAHIFALDPMHAQSYAQNLPKLPEGAEGWFAVPSVDAIVAKSDSECFDQDQKYCIALQTVISRLSEHCRFRDLLLDEKTPDRLRVTARTQRALCTIVEKQPGDILLIPAQLGMRHRGKSVRRACEVFVRGEFGLTSLMVGSILLTHPGRISLVDQLNMHCAGDEYYSPGFGVSFSCATIFYFESNFIRFGTNRNGNFASYHAVTSGFVGGELHE